MSVALDTPTLPAPRSGLRRALTHSGVLVGGGILAALVLVAVFAPLIAPHDPYAQSLVRRFRPPVWETNGSWTFILGTDAFGRDLLSRLIHGTQISLVIGFASAALAGVIGTTLGVLAGYFGGRTDAAISFIVSTRLAMPALLVALAVLQIAGSGTWIVVLVLGLTLWDRFAVVMRAATQQARVRDYVTAARAVGASHAFVILREILPNVLAAFVVVFTLQMAQAILSSAVLSFLGLGVQAPTPSWGLMVAEGRAGMMRSHWLVTLPGLCVMILVLAVNLLGDALRDIVAPDTRA